MPQGATITVNRDAAAAQGAIEAANRLPDEQVQALRARRAALREKARAEAVSGQFAGAEPQDGAEDVTVPPREDVAAVIIALPDGREVEFGPPAGVSLTMRLMTGFAQMPMTAANEVWLKTLMCVRTINGGAVRAVGNIVDAQKLANDIGDEALALLTEAYLQFWPPPRRADLKVIQKKMRGA